MNADVINFVADAIEESGRFNLNVFADYVDRDLAPQGLDGWSGTITGTMVMESCNTTACVAGWFNALDEHDSLSDTGHAAELMGIDYAAAWALFYGDRSIWMMDSAMDKATAVDAARVLRSIASGAMVWDGEDRWVSA